MRGSRSGRRLRRVATVIVGVVVLAAGTLAQPTGVATLDPTIVDSLVYRHIGPVGNRVSAVVGVPGDPNIYYIGAASGGIFKTIDGGVHWRPVFDDQPAASIGALALDPINPNVIWAGTGETFIRSNVSIGNGIYKSMDAGKTWTHMGLEATGRIGRIVVHPTDPDVVLAAAMGHLYGPQEERGVFRTIDGGDTWERVLFVDEHTGASDLVMDPNNPEVVFAGMWQMVMWTWGRESGGPGSGLYRSHDGGETWMRLEGGGLPASPLGKIGLAMSPDSSDRVYALIETNSNREYGELGDHDGVLWRSDDGGERWRMVNGDHALVQRPLYYSRAAVAPDDRDEIHFMSTRHTVSLDGGLTVERGNAGGDNHDMWIDPMLPDRMIVGHDGGVSISTNRGRSWWRPRLPIAQMYHAYTDNDIPYAVYGNRQDGPSARVPSNSLTSGDIPIGMMHSIGGCESGFAVPDPVDSHIVWSGCYDSILERYDRRTGHSRNVSVWPDNPEGWPAADVKFRFQWTFPIAISPHDHERVYVGSQHVHRTTDGGDSWTVISPDLTTDDESRQRKTGGLTPDDTSPTYAAVLFAIAESPLEAGVIWAGSNDGLVHVTRDAGETWANVTGAIPDLPPWGTVSNIEPSGHAASTAYISVDLHQVNDTAPYVYKTTDYGATWRSLGADLPRSVFSYVHVVREDPVRAGLLYVGTENGVYVSLDDGAHWASLQTNLPHAPVHWLSIQPHFNDLVVATYGRGFWILDDITPLQQLDDDTLSAEVHLFAPRPAYRFRLKEAPMSQPEDSGAGTNPPYGASLHYALDSERAEAGDVRVEVLDRDGSVIRTLDDPPANAGINRVSWDLRHDPTDEPRLRTPAIEHSHVRPGDSGWREAGDGGRVRLLAAPGTYTVRLRAGDTERTETLEVLKDPSSAGTDADVQSQSQMLFELRDALNAAVAIVNEAEAMREQVSRLSDRLSDHPASAEILPAAEALDEALVDLEMNLTDLRLSGGMARQDTIRWPRQLLAKLSSLAGYVGQSDFAPTTQQREVFAEYRVKLADSEGRMQAIRDGALADLNRLLDAQGVAVVGGS